MTADELCKHELTRANCDFCKPRPRLGTFRKPVFTVPAAFETFCPSCPSMIEEGDPIALNDDGDWVHEDCAHR